MVADERTLSLVPGPSAYTRTMILAGGWWAALAAGLMGASPIDQGSAELEADARAKLARLCIAQSRGFLDDRELSLAEYDAARTLAFTALELAPDSKVAVALALEITEADSADPEAAWKRRDLLARLAVLDPSDASIPLRRIVAAVETQQSAAGRTAALQRLIAPESIARIGAPAGARLAYDLALLQARAGDSQASREAIARAAELDRWFPQAAAVRAGEAVGTAAPVIEQARLLVAAFNANPIDPSPLGRLAALLLAERAYSAVPELLEMAAEISRTERHSSDEADAYQVDAALARAAMGNDAAAFQALQNYARARDAVYRRELVRARTALTEVALLQESAPQPPQMTMVLGALAQAVGDPAGAPILKTIAAGAVAIANSVAERDRLAAQPARRGEQPPSPPSTADREDSRDRIVELGVALAILGADSATLTEMEARATACAPLSESGTAMLAAWRSELDGRHAEAVERFQQLSNPGAASRVGLARALAADGNTKEAALVCQQVVESAPGTMIGVLAERMLAKLLNVAARPPGPNSTELAAVVAQIPDSLRRAVTGAAMALVLSVQPLTPVCEAFGPIEVELRLRNQLDRPLDIDAMGPVRTLAMLGTEITVTGEAGERTLAPAIIRLDRALELAPYSELVMRVDIGLLPRVFDRLSLGVAQGALVDVRSIVNFTSNGGALIPGVFGRTAVAPTIRVAGVPPDPEWPANAMAEVRAGFGRKTLLTLVLLTSLAGSTGSSEDNAVRERNTQIWTFVSEVWPQLPLTAQAWLLCASPGSSPGMARIFDEAAKSKEPLLRYAAAVYAAESTDPALVLEGTEDPRLQSLIKGIKERLARLADARRTSPTGLR